MSNDPRLSDVPLPPRLCLTCKHTFTPRYLGLLKKWSKVCPNCALINLAKLMEEEDPEMTIKEISDGEQVGAFLRQIANPANR